MSQADPKTRQALEETLRQQLSQLDRPGEAGTRHELGSLHLREGRYAEACSEFRQSLRIRQEIGDRGGEAASFFQLGAVAMKLGKVEDCARLTAICCAIDRSIGHADADFDFHVLDIIGMKLGYAQSQIESLMAESAQSHQADGGWGLIEAAFGIGN